LLIFLFHLFRLYQFSGDVATREVQIPTGRKALTRNFRPCGGFERIFESFEIAKTVLWRWFGPEKSSKRPAMHRARGRVLFDWEH
jgi:hypothetical protein